MLTVRLKTLSTQYGHALTGYFLSLRRAATGGRLQAARERGHIAVPGDHAPGLPCFHCSLAPWSAPGQQPRLWLVCPCSLEWSAARVLVLATGMAGARSGHQTPKACCGCCTQVTENWFPADAQRQARVNAAMDWHHSSIRRGVTGQARPLPACSPVVDSGWHGGCAVACFYQRTSGADAGCSEQVWHRVLAPMAGLPASAREAKQGAAMLAAALQARPHCFPSVLVKADRWLCARGWGIGAKAKPAKRSCF